MTKLELGSGYNPTPGFVHLDLNPNAPGVDIVGPAFPLPPSIPLGSVTEIRAVDVLEHLSYRDTDKALANWSAVMTKGGRLYAQVPDAETIMLWFAHQPSELLRNLPPELPQTPMAGAAWRLLGGHADGSFVGADDDWRFNAHYAMFSRDSLSSALRRAGLAVSSVTRNAHPNLLAWARRQ